jgi:hypothetical protein
MSLKQKAEIAKNILSGIIPDVICVEQEWDNRIDCFIITPDQKIIGEMIPAEEITEERIISTGLRLKRRLSEERAPLINEIRSPRHVRVRKKIQ